MSIKVRTIAKINDIISLRKYLFPNDELIGGDSWLNSCITSISPTGELIVFAKDNNIVILSQKWDLTNNQNTYSISFSAQLENEIITCLSCIPIAPLNQTSIVCPDWTCIVVGLSNGFVKFYTENFQLITSGQFLEDRVVHLKFQSQLRQRFEKDYATVLSEEFHVLYSCCICILNGNQLVQTLRLCRSELAKKQATKKEINDQSFQQLIFKKLIFTDQSVLHDAAIVGPENANMFDHLLTASTCGGFNARYRYVAPRNTLCIGVGAEPFVGFHYALDGGTQPDLRDVAKAFAIKIKSALPSWLVGSETTGTNLTQTGSVQSSSSIGSAYLQQPAESMAFKFGLNDERRIADIVDLSPEKSLAIVTDSLGRVTLIDTRKGICLRQWKGYREAQCSFLVVYDEESIKVKNEAIPNSDTKHKRSTLVLIIYAPKKNVFEIWPLQQGDKIATFSASKYSKLIYTNYTMMGMKKECRIKLAPLLSTIFISSNGEIKDIHVPFHYTLGSISNSQRAKDLHLIKCLKDMLKRDEENKSALINELKTICREVKTETLQFQLIDILLNYKKIQPDILSEAVSAYLELRDEINDKLFLLCNNIYLLCNFFMFVTSPKCDIDETISFDHDNNQDLHKTNTSNENNNQSSSDKQNQHPNDIKNNNPSDNNLNDNPIASTSSGVKLSKMDTQLIITENELNKLQRLLDIHLMYSKTNRTKVKFAADTSNDLSSKNFHEFLNAFEFKNQTSLLEKITLKSDVFTNNQKLYNISIILFNSFINNFNNCVGTLDLNGFSEHVQLSNIRRSDLVIILLSYWLYRELIIGINFEVEMHTFSQLILSICEKVDEEICALDCNDISPFWSNIRQILYSSIRPFHALIASIICKGVAAKLEYDIEGNEDDAKWEKFTQENCLWQILIGQLEDVSILDLVINSSDENYIEKCPTFKNYQLDNISLKNVIDNGKGSISELIAKWIISNGYNLDFISTIDQIEEVKDEENVIFFKKFQLLRSQFPYSLELNVLYVNLAWEYVLLWQKLQNRFEYFDASLKCLKLMTNGDLEKGISNLIWSTHMKLHLECISKLINKVGKLPKERLCKQDTNFTDVELTMCLNYFTDFFDEFMNCFEKTSNGQKETSINFYLVQFDKLWSTDENYPINNFALIELATQHCEVNFDIIYVHYLLCLVLQSITIWNLKLNKPISNLFDSKTSTYFFKDLSNFFDLNFAFYNTDPKLKSFRMEFLFKLLSVVIENIRVGNDGQIYSNEYNDWLVKCQNFFKIWDLDSDKLKYHQIKQLYINGFDSLAEIELKTATNRRYNLANDLRDIAARRLYNFIYDRNRTKTEIKEILANLPPSLTAYLKRIESDGDLAANKVWCTPVEFDKIYSLVCSCIECYGEDGNNLANLLLEACDSLSML